MKKVTVKNLIEFRGKNDRTKITFVNNLKKEKVKSDDDSSGGDYWSSALSAIRNTFKYDNAKLLDEKIELLLNKIETKENERIENQFRRNLEIVSNFKEYDFEHLKPEAEIKFLKQKKYQSLLTIKGLPIEAKPCHIYSFSINKSEEIGGIWFVAQLDGFKKSELAMFADILYRYLNENYAKEFFVNAKYCIAVDLYKGQDVSYKDIQEGNIPVLIESTLDDFKKYR
ncbi:MAG: hypothetical protein LLF80_06630 [Porphyromonadaceae bacterium]|nr:hypothetical protein [Porphyromonadaceae bacterium]